MRRAVTLLAVMYAVRWSLSVEVPCPQGSSASMRCVEQKQFDERFTTLESADVFARVIRYTGAPGVTVVKLTGKDAQAKPTTPVSQDSLTPEQRAKLPPVDHDKPMRPDPKPDRSKPL